MNDDEFGALLLRPLAGEPAGTPRIDVARAIRDGRRMRRRRWWSGGTALIAAITATVVGGSLLLSPAQQDDKHVLPDLPPDPPVPTACTASLLPMGGNRAVQVTAADPSGRWQAGTTDPNSYWPDKRKLLVWHDRRLVTMTSGAELGIALSDLNSAGVGVGRRDGQKDTPYLYRGGELTTLKGGDANAIAINDAGMIAGEVGAFNHERPARWASPEAGPERLPLPPGAGFTRVQDITPDGTVVGEVDDEAYVWPAGGGYRKLEPPPPPSDTTKGAEPIAPGLSPDRPLIRPMGFSFGWLYATVTYGAGRPAFLYRLDLASGTWQPVGKHDRSAQLTAAGLSDNWAQEDPAVWVGRRKLELPKYDPALRNRLDAFAIRGVSDDVHVVSGTAFSSVADLAKPLQPIIWECR
jgi:hypothetical protein